MTTFQDTDGAQKRNSLEDLNKEEVIKKCKSLLVIAQRAKQAKDGKIWSGDSLERIYVLYCSGLKESYNFLVNLNSNRCIFKVLKLT